MLNGFLRQIKKMLEFLIRIYFFVEVLSAVMFWYAMVHGHILWSYAWIAIQFYGKNLLKRTLACVNHQLEKDEANLG